MTKVLYASVFFLGALSCFLMLGAAGAAGRPDPTVGFRDWVAVCFSVAALLASLGALYFKHSGRPPVAFSEDQLP